MNVMLSDYRDCPDRKEAPKSYKSKKLQSKIKNAFEYNLYQDVSNVFQKNNSQREFITNPVTTIPNRQKDFANWCYNNPVKTKLNHVDINNI